MTHETPEDLRYTDEHEWVRIEDGTAAVGITDFAQDALTDVVYVDLPKTGTEVSAGEAFCVVESVKSVSDIYAPVSGTLTKVNDRLADEPGLINDDPYGDGWIVVIEMDDPSQVDGLMSADDYRAHVADQE